MATVDPISPSVEWSVRAMLSVGDVLAHLGDISPGRIPLGVPIGRATEKDLLDLLDHSDRICELVDGVLVEKVMSSRESFLAGYILHLIYQYLDEYNLGIVLGADGMLRILPDQVRIPDVAFIRWERLPGRKIPQEPIFGVVPNIAVEVLSPGNTRGEMRRKLKDYFAAGVQLAWFLDPVTRSARVYHTEHAFTDYAANDELSGGDVLPGFSLPLSKVFAKLDAVG